MTDDKPYDYTQLDEIVLFKGQRDTIELSREGRYINIVKGSSARNLSIIILII